MIGRHWRGFAPHETAQAYLEHLRESTLPSLRDIVGHRGATVLKRRVDGEVEFVVLTFWDSLDAVRAFAGDDYEAAVVPPEARELLAEFDDRVVHYEVAVEPAGR
jgi:heme-degrading monooxygenase HmoA